MSGAGVHALHRFRLMCILEAAGEPGEEEKGRPAVTQDQHTQQDPMTQYPQPEFGEQQLEHPGLESEMRPKPDYGGDTYRGSGKLEGKAAIITGGDSGIGRLLTYFGPILVIRLG